MSRAMKIAIAVCVLCMLTIGAMGAFGIAGCVKTCRAEAMAFNEAWAYISTIPEEATVVYVTEGDTQVVLPNGIISMPEEYSKVLFVDKSYIYSLKRDYENDMQYIVRTDHSFGGEETVFEAREDISISMADSQTLVYKEYGIIYSYRLDTKKLVEWEEKSIWSVKTSIMNNSSYYIKTIADGFAVYRDGTEIAALTDYDRLTLGEEEHVKAVEEIYGERMNLNDAYVINESVYVDLTLSYDGYSYMCITYRFDPEAKTFIYAGSCKWHDLDEGYSVLELK